MGKSVSTPAAPDPNATAQAQSNYDKNTALFNAQLNRFNVSTPYGSLNWNQTQGSPTFNQAKYDAAVKAAQGSSNGKVFDFGGDPGTGIMPDRNDPQFYDQSGPPQYSQQITLNPTSQATLDATQGNALNLAKTQGEMLANARGKMVAPLDTSGLPQVGSVPGLADKATKAAYDTSMALLGPQMDIQRNLTATDLANKGIPVGSEGYNNQMGSLDRQQDWQRQLAANSAFQTGQGYDNQLFNQGLNSNQNAFSQLLALRNQPLNEYNAMMTGTQVQAPQFQGTPSVMANAPNYMGAVGQQYQGQLNAYNAQTGANNSFMSGLMNLGAAALPVFF